MSKKTPAAPRPPDYAAANEAGINADINTLERRRTIEAQARLGQGVFGGLGDADISQQLFEKDLANAPAAAAGLLDLQQRYGPAFAEQARKSLEATDPTGFALRDQFGSQLRYGDKSIEALANQGPAAPEYEQLAGNGPAKEMIGGGPNFQSLGGAAGAQRVDQSSMPEFADLGDAAAMGRVGTTNLRDAGASAAGRADLERQIFGELGLAGLPDAAIQRSAEQAARARGAARGNILGDSSALQESLGVQLAQRQLDSQRRNDALGLLASGQGTSDTSNRMQLAQQQSDVAGAGFNNESAQQDFSNRATRAGFNNANRQQGLENLMATSGFNNEASQQDFDNRGQSTQFNNANAQQSFSNRASAVGQNNNASDQAFQNAMNAVNQRNQSKQNTFGAQQGVMSQRAGGRQQDLANVQSFLGLQPVVSQGAQLSGLQQGAAPFVQNTYNGANINPGAGQLGGEWAGQLYGAQSQMFAGMAQAKAAKSAGTMGAIAGVAAATAPYWIPVVKGAAVAF